jgi:hypothetical protein
LKNIGSAIPRNGSGRALTISLNSQLFLPAAEQLEMLDDKPYRGDKTMDNTQNSPMADLASELGVEIEALEERLEMVGIEAMACCSVNFQCKSSLQ